MGKTRPLNPPRVVLDTNCLVSALLFSQGRIAWLRHAWQSGRFVPLVSRDTVSELIRVLKYPKFKLEHSQQEILLGEFLPYAETVTVGPPEPDTPNLRDPNDVVFLVLARQAAADVLVSGDEDLQTARNQLNSILILTPVEFSVWLERRA